MLFALVGAYYLFHISRFSEGEAIFAEVTAVARVAKAHGAAGHPHVAQRINATATIRETETVMMTISIPADPVVFVLIMISADSASEGAILIKVRNYFPRPSTHST
jgi:uncharacterized protein YbjT (DUF2867 family)